MMHNVVVGLEKPATNAINGVVTPVNDNVKKPSTLGHKIPTKTQPYNNPKNTPNTFIPNGVICPNSGKNPPQSIKAIIIAVWI